jgi:hypothetical protein
MQASFWQCIQLANVAAFTQTRWGYFIAPATGPFEPGDLGGSIFECFNELLEDSWYPGKKVSFSRKADIVSFSATSEGIDILRVT